MSKYNMKVVAVILAGSAPTEEEQEKATALAARNIRYCNGRFTEPVECERISCTSVLNLSGREDLDEFYKDKLIDLDKHLNSLADKIKSITSVKEAVVVKKEVVKKEVKKEDKKVKVKSTSSKSKSK